MTRLVGDQLEQDQPQLALVEDPAPAAAPPFVGLAPAAVATAAEAVGSEVVAVAVAMLVTAAGMFLKSHSISFFMFNHV